MTRALHIHKHATHQQVADDDGPAAPDVYALFPGFRPDKVLKFSELFHRTKGSTRASRAAAPSSSMTPAQRATRKQRMEALARLLRQRSLPAFDQRHLFESDVPLLETAVSSSNAADDLYALMKGRSSVEEFGGEGMGDGTGLGGKLLCSRDSRESLASAGTGNEVVMDLDASELHPLNTTDWESRIVWEEGDRGVADAATAQQAPGRRRVSVAAYPYSHDLRMTNFALPPAIYNSNPDTHGSANAQQTRSIRRAQFRP